MNINNFFIGPYDWVNILFGEVVIIRFLPKVLIILLFTKFLFPFVIFDFMSLSFLFLARGEKFFGNLGDCYYLCR